MPCNGSYTRFIFGRFFICTTNWYKTYMHSYVVKILFLWIVGVTVIVPFFMLLLFKVLMLLTSVFDPAACISTMYDIAQISVISVSSSAAFLWWSETACRVPTWTLWVVKLVTLCFVITVECRVNHGCCVQHHLEARHVCINFFIVLWQVGVSWLKSIHKAKVFCAKVRLTCSPWCSIRPISSRIDRDQLCSRSRSVGHCELNFWWCLLTGALSLGSSSDEPKSSCGSLCLVPLWASLAR
jgi:hypothetical protein